MVLSYSLFETNVCVSIPGSDCRGRQCTSALFRRLGQDCAGVLPGSPAHGPLLPHHQGLHGTFSPHTQIKHTTETDALTDINLQLLLLDEVFCWPTCGIIIGQVRC